MSQLQDLTDAMLLEAKLAEHLREKLLAAHCTVREAKGLGELRDREQEVSALRTALSVTKQRRDALVELVIDLNDNSVIVP